MRKLIPLLLMLIASPVFAYDMYYYVSPSWGDNSNWGESSALAWATGDYATDNVPNWGSVAVFFECTDYYEQIDHDAVEFTSDSQLSLIGDYEGTYWGVSGQYPWIQVIDARDKGIYSNKSYTNVKWIAFTGKQADTGVRQIEVVAPGSYWNVQSCVFRHGYFGTSFYGDYMNIDDCDYADMFYGVVNWAGADNSIVRNSRFDTCTGNGMYYLSVDGLVDRCKFYDCGVGGTDSSILCNDKTVSVTSCYIYSGNIGITAVGTGGSIYNNILVDNVRGVKDIQDGVPVSNNILQGNTIAFADCDDTAADDITFNMLTGNATDWDSATGSDNIYAEPGLFDEHKILDSSPAFDAGVYWVPAQTLTDIDGQARIRNGALDTGAYEVQTGTVGFNLNFDSWTSETDLIAWDLTGCFATWTTQTHEGTFAAIITSTTSGSSWLAQTISPMVPARASGLLWEWGTGGAAFLDWWCASTSVTSAGAFGSAWNVTTILDYQMGGEDTATLYKVDFTLDSDNWIVVDGATLTNWANPYNATPMQSSDITDIRIGTTRSSVTQGWSYWIVDATDLLLSYSKVYDNQNQRFDAYSGFSTLALKIDVTLSDTYAVEKGDWINVTGTDADGLVMNRYIYPPLAPMTIDTYYYIGDDGSTYNDIWLTRVAQAAPTPSPTPSPHPALSPPPTPRVITPSPTAYVAPTATPTPRVITPTPTTVQPTPSPTPIVPDTYVTYYFSAYDVGEAWGSNPGNMVDGDIANVASSIAMATQLCDENTCLGTDLGPISTVELRMYAYGESGTTYLIPVFDGAFDGQTYFYDTPGSIAWTEYTDITYSVNAPNWSSWTHVQNLDCDVFSWYGSGPANQVGKVDIRVYYDAAPTPTPVPTKTPVPTPTIRDFGYRNVTRAGTVYLWKAGTGSPVAGPLTSSASWQYILGIADDGLFGMYDDAWWSGWTDRTGRSLVMFDMRASPSPTPSPDTTPTPSVTPTVTPTPTPTITPTPSITPTPTVTPSPSSTPVPPKLMLMRHSWIYESSMVRDRMLF